MAAVLIADDDNNLRGTLEELLKGAGIEVVAVANGEAALQAATERARAGNPFDLVVLDLLLPKVQGQDVAKRLREQGVKPALVFMSGVFKSGGIVTDITNEFAPKAFLAKPFNNDELLQLCLDAAPAAPTKAKVEQRPMPAEGGLLEAPALHLLWRAAREGHTGILDIFGQGRRGRVFVYRGRTTMAQCSDPQVNVGVELIRQGVLTADMYQEAVAKAHETKKGLYDYIKSEKWADEQALKKGYKDLIPAAIGHIVAASGSFRWTDTDAFAKLVPAAPYDLMKALTQALRMATLDQLQPHVDPRQTLRLAPGENWDEILAIMDQACGSSSLARAINGRATIAQMLSAARNDEDRASRYRQAYLLMSTQAVMASLEVIKMNAPAQLPPEPAPAPAAAAPKPAPATSAPASRSAAAQMAKVKVGDDDGIDFSPEEKDARARIKAKLKEVRGKGHYEVLGVERGASAGDIKKAYFALAKEFHPDSFSGLRLGSAQDALDALYAVIQEAQGVLNDEKKRAEYDAELNMADAGMTTDIGALFEAERHFTKAKTLVDRGEMVGSVRLLEAAHAVNPQNGEWEAYLVYARWWQNRNPAEANAAISRIEAIYKDMPALHDLGYFCGHIAVEAGDMQRGARYLKRVLNEQPNHVMAQRALRNVAKKNEEAEKKGGGLGRFLKR